MIWRVKHVLIGILAGVLVVAMGLVGCGGGAMSEGDARATGASSESSKETEGVGTVSEGERAGGDGLSGGSEEGEGEYEIHAVIPRDRIPAILEPEFLDAGAAVEAYSEFEQVLGLSINGDHRAYPIPYLSRHEIVNDVVGGKPVAVTW